MPRKSAEGFFSSKVVLSLINGDEVTFHTSFICLDPNGYFQYLLAGNIVDSYDGYVFDFDGTEDVFPWDYYSYNLFTDYNNPTLRVLYHYFERYDTIGARVLYITEDGEYLYSDPLTYDVNTGTVGIDQTVVNHGEVVETVYTSLAGMQVSRPQQGIYIKTIIFADGTRSVRKVMVK